MKHLTRWALSASMVASTLTLGLTSASQASEIRGAATAAAAPCGLSYTGPVFGRYDYTIRNCHDHTVKRKLDIRVPIVGFPDGPCHTIRAHSSISDWISIPDSAHIDGIKSC